MTVYTLDEILKHADPLVVKLKTKSRNTLNPDRDYADMLGGDVGHDGHDTSISHENDEVIYFSDRTVPELNTRRLLGNEIQVTNTLPKPFSGRAGGSTVSTFRIEDDAASVSLERKLFDGTEYTLEAGGTLYRGESTEVTLTNSEYRVWSSGRITSFDLGAEVSLAASRLPVPLLEQFPVNVHTYGQSEGLAKDYLIGSHRNHSPKPVADGLFDFHDGKISGNRDTVFNGYPITCLEDGEIFGNVSYPTSSTPDLTYDETDFDWTVSGRLAVKSNTPILSTMTLDSDKGILSVSDDGKIVMESKIEPTSSASAFDFRWTKTDSRTLQSSGKYPVTVTTSGDLIIREEMSYWFKFTGPNSSPSTVTWKFHKPVADITLVARSINTNMFLGNWSKEPDSITPDYATQSNSDVVITNVGSDTLTFDFKGNGIFGHATHPGQLVAFWIKEVTFYEPARVKATFNFAAAAQKLVMDFNAVGGQKLVGMSSEYTQASFELEGSLEEGFSAGETTLTWEDLNVRQLELEFELGHGETSIEVSELVTVQGGSYGAFFEEGFIRLAPADQSDARFVSNIIDESTGEGTTLVRDLRFRARVVGRDEVDILWGYEKYEGAGELSLPITRNWQEYSFRDLGNSIPAGASGDIFVSGEVNPLYTNVLGGTFATEGLYVRVDRSSETPGGTDYEVQITSFYDTLTTQGGSFDAEAQDVKVLDPSSSEEEFLQTFKVSDAASFPKLPSVVAVYDENGKVKTSPKYSRISGKFHGVLASDVSSVDAPDSGTVERIVHLDDGKILIAGSFTSYAGVTANRIARLNADGTLDPTFDVGDGPDLAINGMDIDSNGMIYVSGYFDSWDGNTRWSLARLFPDGAYDDTFEPTETTWTLYGVFVQSNDKPVVFGQFDDFFLDDSYEGMMRLNADGTPDPTFTHDLGWTVNAFKLSGDRILANGTMRDANGGHIATFANITNMSVLAVDDYDDDHIVVAGPIIGEGVFSRVAVLNNDTGVEIGNTANVKTDNGIRAVVAIDGQIFAFGFFTTVNSIPLVRAFQVSLDGTLNRDFGADGGFNGSVYAASVALNSTTILVGGSFETYKGYAQKAITALDADGVYPSFLATQALSRISSATTGTDYVANQIQSYPVAVPFTKQRPVIDWIDDIASGCDLVYEIDSETSRLSFAKRYSGESNPQQFRIYEKQMVPYADGQLLKRLRSTPAESAYVVSYYDSKSSETAPIDQAFGTVLQSSTDTPKEIRSFVTQKNDAQYLANRDVRDVYGQSEYECEVLGLGLGITIGQVGYIYTSRTNGFNVEIVSVNEKRGTETTSFIVNLYDMRRGNNDI